MRKAFYVFLLGSVLSVPFLGAPKAHAASIINHFGQCLDDQSEDTRDGNPIVTRGCFGLFSQQWKWEGPEIQGIGTFGSVGKCVTRTAQTDGAPVQLFQCNGSFSQQWDFSDGQIKSPFSGMCLTGDATQFLQATVRTCDPANPGQFWSIRS